MTKFEQIGVNFQYNAESKRGANKAFKYSCDVCCNKGIHLDCEKCAIAVAHSLVVAAFDDMEQKGKQVSEMKNLKAYYTRGELLLEFDILQSLMLNGKPCYLAVVKGTEQMAWLCSSTIEFWTHTGNAVLPMNPDLELTIVSEI